MNDVERIIWWVERSYSAEWDVSPNRCLPGFKSTSADRIQTGPQPDLTRLKPDSPEPNQTHQTEKRDSTGLEPGCFRVSTRQADYRPGQLELIRLPTGLKPGFYRITIQTNRQSPDSRVLPDGKERLREMGVRGIGLVGKRQE